MTVRKWEEVKEELFSGREEELRAASEQLRGEVRAYRLAEIRRARHLTQQQVAGELGITKARVSQIEHGQVNRAAIRGLADYVAALGGRLELVADFGDERIVIGLPESRMNGPYSRPYPRRRRDDHHRLDDQDTPDHSADHHSAGTQHQGPPVLPAPVRHRMTRRCDHEHVPADDSPAEPWLLAIGLDLTLVPTAQGGRKTPLLLTEPLRYRPNWGLPGTDQTGAPLLCSSAHTLAPGDSARAVIIPLTDWHMTEWRLLGEGRQAAYV